MGISSQIVQYLISGITLGSIYAIIALGFTIIHNVTGIINFAQGEFVMLGGMITFSLLHSLSLPLPVAFLLAVIITAIVGFLLERLAIRPAKAASVVSLIIITIGASIFIRGIAGQVWGKDAVPIPSFSGETPIPVLGATISTQSLWIIFTTLIIMILLKLFFDFTMLGKSLRACAVNKKAAQLMGINVETMSFLSFGLAAALGAIGGIIIAPITLTSYGVGVMLGVKGFIAAAIGGLSSYVAAVVGGIGLGVLESLSAGLITSAYKDAIALLVLFIVLLYRVRGKSGD